MLPQKVVELFLALGEALVRFAELLTDRSFSAFQPGDLLRLKPQFHLIHCERRQRPEHFRLA